MTTLRIATRKSPMALCQTNFIKKQLQQLHPKLKIELVPLSTKGDEILDRSLSKIGGKGLFIKELEIALQENRADIAVHSLKDVPMILPEEFSLPVIYKRDDPRDAFVSNDYDNLQELPDGSRVGTSSLRRQSQLRALYPQLQFIDLRGNANTRLQKLDDGEFDAIILAQAGLQRLQLTNRTRAIISETDCLPAIGQGTLAIECRAADDDIVKFIAPLNDKDTTQCITAERAFGRKLGASCQIPLAAFATLKNKKITLQGLVATPDGKKILREQISADVADAEKIGMTLADKLIKQGALEIIDNILKA